MTKPGRQWIHADAGYYQDPLALRIKDRFGWSGVVFFDAFLRGCKRSVPQGRVVYASEEELVHFLGVADLLRASCAGDAWSITDFWRFLARLRPPMVTSSRVHGRVMVTSCAWDDWEMSAASATHAERMRRSRAQKRDTNVSQKITRERGRLEVGGGRLEVGGGSVRGDSAPAPTSPQKGRAGAPEANGMRRPADGLKAIVAALEAQAAPEVLDG